MSGAMYKLSRSGDEAARRTAREVRTTAVSGSADPEIISLAARLTRRFDTVDAKARAIQLFIAGHIDYEADGFLIETIIPARDTLARRYGDCKKQTVLVGALLIAAGLPFTVGLCRVNDRPDYGHVVAMTDDGLGWFPVETIEAVMPRGHALGVCACDPFDEARATWNTNILRRW